MLVRCRRWRGVQRKRAIEGRDLLPRAHGRTSEGAAGVLAWRVRVCVGARVVLPNGVSAFLCCAFVHAVGGRRLQRQVLRLKTGMDQATSYSMPVRDLFVAALHVYK